MAFRPISRRTMLRGLGTALALPWLEAMAPRLAFADTASAAGTAGEAAPLRMAFMYVPNGMNMQHWTPAEVGSNFTLPKTLQALEPYRQDLLVLSGLAQEKAEANGDGGGDHARALSTFLTGVQVRKTDGADIRAGISVDQIAAQHFGNSTRFPSLEIGCDGGAQSGNCDSGYSCAYSSNISWRSPNQPLPQQTDPAQIFDRLFSVGKPGESAAARGRRERYSQSILDFVRDDSQRLQKSLGRADRNKLDEYLTAVRELETRIAWAQRSEGQLVDMARPSAPANYEEHLRLLGDLMVLAFQTDQTRVCTFVMSNEGSGRSYGFIGVPEAHHELSHHQRNEEKLAKIQKIDEFHVRQVAYVLERLKTTYENGRPLLENTMLLYGSGIGDGDRHNHDDLPLLLAGHGGGTISPGRHIKYDHYTPLTNLYRAMLTRIGCEVDAIGDSNGVLDQLSV